MLRLTSKNLIASRNLKESTQMIMNSKYVFKKSRSFGLNVIVGGETHGEKATTS